ncbi:MAG: hypothetical protein JXA67_10300 [Micromonosporaceae bacterium]|nr:hypothetical protein [Micromonosporaceae bacterium]
MISPTESAGTDSAVIVPAGDQQQALFDLVNTHVDRGEYVEAVDLLVAHDDGSAAVLRRLSWIEWLAGRKRLSLELAAAALARDPRDLESVVEYAGALTRRRYFREAVAVLTNRPDHERDQVIIRLALVEVYRVVGTWILACDAYGTPHDLGVEDRQRRRSLLWHTWGPLARGRRRRAEQAIIDSLPAEKPHLSETDPAVLLDRVCALAGSRRRDQALATQASRLLLRQQVEEAAAVLGSVRHPTPTVLRRRAVIAALRGDHEAALVQAERAAEIDPEDCATIGRRIAALRDLGRFRDALALVEHLPDRLGGASAVRVEISEMYQRMGLPGLAVEAYGDPRTLSQEDRRLRRGRWWRIGGPFRIIRGIRRRIDGRALSMWQGAAGRLRVFDGLPWPEGFDPAAARVRLDRQYLRWAVQEQFWLTVQSLVSRGVVAVGLGAVWLVLTLIASSEVGLGVVAAPVAGLGAAVLAGVLHRWIFRRARARTVAGVLARGAPLGLTVLCAGVVIILGGGGWPLLIGATILSVAALGAGRFVLAAPIDVIWSYRSHQLSRGHAREYALDELLGILGEATDRARRNDLGTRARWIAALERAARRLETRLPAEFGFGDAATAVWARQRAAGAAAAVRRLKRQISAPVPGSWDMLIRVVRQDAVLITTGELGRLRWRQPPQAGPDGLGRWWAGLNDKIQVALSVATIGRSGEAPRGSEARVHRLDRRFRSE